MGMSASQLRLLTLTARLSDLEFQAQGIENARIRLSQKGEQVAKDYNNALGKKTLNVMSGVDATTGTYQYVTANAYNLTTYNAVSAVDKQRFLKDNYGNVLVTEGVASAFNKSGGTLEGFLNQLGYTSDQSKNNTKVQLKEKVQVSPTSDMPGATIIKEQTVKYDSGAVSYYTNVFNQMTNGYNSPGNENMYSSDWLYSQLTAGNIHLEEWNEAGGTDGKGAYEEVSWSSGDPTIQTRNDDQAAAKAEAEYTAATAEIQTKDKQLELSLKQIDTEHGAIQTEYDSVKKVIDKNIERSFKTFNA